MNLTAIFLIKVLLVMACAVGMFLLLRKQCDKRWLALCLTCVTVLAAAYVGQQVSKAVSPLTDVVTVTAVGEKNPEASSLAVSLSGYTVDGIKYPVENAIEGKWFWYGDNLMWRAESNPNQPAGTTRSVQVTVPVGRDRTVNFPTNKWRGIATVQFDGEEQTIDLYSEKNSTVKVEIASSDNGLLALNALRILAVFAVFLFCFAALVSTILYLWLKNPETLKARFSSRFWIIYAAIAAVSLLHMFLLGGEEGFWQDELSSISSYIEGKSLVDTLFVTHESYYPSIFSRAIMSWWYSIAPYGEQFLLIPMMICTALGGFFTALAAEKVANRRVGLLTCIFSAFSYPISYYCGMEARTYAFLYCMCALMLFSFFAKNERTLNGQSPLKHEILFGASVFLAAASHVFGVFLACLLFVVDGILWFAKKVKLRFAIPYVSAALVFSPWIYNMFCCNVLSKSEAFQETPSSQKVIDLLEMLSGEQKVAFYLLLFACCFALVSAVRRRKEPSVAALAPLVPVWLLAGLICGIYFYGIYINPDATMWVNRYFVVLFPAASILICCAADEIFHLLSQKTVRDAVILLVVCQFVFSSHSLLKKDISVERQTFKDTADWLYKDAQAEDVYKKSTAIVACAWPNNIAGWKEYYLEEQGRRDPLNVISMESIKEDTLDPYKTLYVYYEVRQPNAKLQAVLDEEFELISHNEKNEVKIYARKDVK